MSKRCDGGVSASDMVETVSNHGASGQYGKDTTTERGRELVREYVADILDASDREFVRARRLLADIGYYVPQENETVDAQVIQEVGQVLAALEDGNAPDGYLPAVTVSRWGDAKRTTWIVEVSR